MGTTINLHECVHTQSLSSNVKTFRDPVDLPQKFLHSLHRLDPTTFEGTSYFPHNFVRPRGNPVHTSSHYCYASEPLLSQVLCRVSIPRAYLLHGCCTIQDQFSNPFLCMLRSLFYNQSTTHSSSQASALPTLVPAFLPQNNNALHMSFHSHDKTPKCTSFVL